MHPKRVSFIIAALVFLSGPLPAVPVVDWLEDSVNGFSLRITGSMAEATGGSGFLNYGHNILLTPTSPTGLWQIRRTGWSVGFIDANFSEGGQALLYSFAIAGEYHGVDAFEFESSGGWGGAIYSLPYAGGTFIHSIHDQEYGQPDPTWYGGQDFRFESETNGDDIKDWNYVLTMSLRAPRSQRVPDGGTTGFLLATGVVGLALLVRRRLMP